MTVVIARVDIAVVRLPLVHEFETSSHRKNHLDHILVRVTSTDGVVGWGECACPSDPYYCGETTETCWSIAGEHLAPLLIDKPWEHPADAAALLAKVSGNPFARAGVEMACWDLYGRVAGESLAALVGGTAERCEAGVSLGIEPTIDDLLTQVQAHLAQGYRRIKLKIRPGWDVAPVRAVREAFGDVTLQVDANTAYPADAAPRLARLDRFGLAMIEQPFAADELLAHARLAQSLDTAICLDESITSQAMLRVALRLGACSIVNVKVSRLGGIAAARAVHDECFARGVPVWCGGMHEFGIGRAANLAVASLPGFVLPSDVSGSDKYYRRDILTEPIRARDGWVPVPRQSPGLGVEIDEEVVAAHTLRARAIRRDNVSVGLGIEGV
ncbi:MAG: o-succinylbenzoate synthase [Actinomycetia bacterium]|nr:o-succinylbenzoate synthase [Actinomycetes bacterium]